MSYSEGTAIPGRRIAIVATHLFSKIPSKLRRYFELVPEQRFELPGAALPLFWGREPGFLLSGSFARGLDCLSRKKTGNCFMAAPISGIIRVAQASSWMDRNGSQYTRIS
jgi:hypothetical protein